MADPKDQPKPTPGQPGAPAAAQAAEEALRRAQQATDNLKAGAGVSEPRAMELPPLGGGGLASTQAAIGLLGDVHLKVKVELGRTRMFVEDVLRLNSGSVLELDKPAGDPVDIYVNDRHIARGEVLVVNDNFCVRVSEIIRAEHPAE